MATTNIHPTMHRRQERQQQNNNYAIVWGLIVAALVAAIAYGYYSSDRAVTEPTEINATQATVTPATDGSTSSMVGTGPASNELTPSTTAPGTPDTTTTESSSVPTQGIQ